MRLCRDWTQASIFLVLIWRQINCLKIRLKAKHRSYPNLRMHRSWIVSVKLPFICLAVGFGLFLKRVGSFGTKLVNLCEYSMVARGGAPFLIRTPKPYPFSALMPPLAQTNAYRLRAIAACLHMTAIVIALHLTARQPLIRRA